jgi:hypothetical protein
VTSDGTTPEERRRASRAGWPIARFTLGAEPPDDLSATTTAAERIAMMWPLALAAWRLAGRPLPTYPRGQAPVRVRRPGVPPPEDG